MKHGDYTLLAKSYCFRPGYSLEVLEMISQFLRTQKPLCQVADVGAGTGKLTENLASLGFSGYAIEPNEAMREQALENSSATPGFVWQAGSAEDTGLDSDAVDWVLMGSSFHWTDKPQALKEFYRILKPGGFFTAIWNPRDIEKSERECAIEAEIARRLPGYTRVSSGSRHYTANLEKELLGSMYFENLIFTEAPHQVMMSRERYLGVWQSVNDLQVQAGPECFSEILNFISSQVPEGQEVCVPYRTRAWTVRSTKA